jgi:hypothetical protein
MSSRHRLLAASALIVSVVACGGSDAPSARDISYAQVKWHWEPTDLRRTYTIRTDSEWLAAWKTNTAPSHPIALRPQIDFTKEMLLGVVQGSAGSGGNSLTITRVTELEDRVQVEYKILTPLPGYDYTFAVVPLADFVVVERIGKPILFLRTDA